MFRAGPLGSIRIASSTSFTRALLRQAFVATLSQLQGLWGPSESRVPHIPRVPYDAQRLSSQLQGLWDPSESRVPCLPRVFCVAQRLSRPFAIAGPLVSIRIASSISPTCELCCPAFVATLRDCRASGIHKNRKFYVSHAFVAPLRFASSTSAARVALCPVFVATLSPLQGLWDPQNRKFHILHVCR